MVRVLHRAISYMPSSPLHKIQTKLVRWYSSWVTYLLNKQASIERAEKNRVNWIKRNNNLNWNIKWFIAFGAREWHWMCHGGTTLAKHYKLGGWLQFQRIPFFVFFFFWKMREIKCLLFHCSNDDAKNDDAHFKLKVILNPSAHSHNFIQWNDRCWEVLGQ